MTSIQELELDARREQLMTDVKGLVEKYRSLFEWDVPEIDELASNRLILGAVRQALDAVERSLAPSATR
ncbi:MAG: hypothetical protein ABIQ90_14465 [Polaromonas sp.]